MSATEFVSRPPTAFSSVAAGRGGPSLPFTIAKRAVMTIATRTRMATERAARTARGFPGAVSGFGVLALAMLFAVPVSAAVDREWTLMRDRDGIQVYSRPAEGSDIREIRAVTTLSASAVAIVSVLKDVSRRPQWDHTCSRAYVYATVGSDEQILYYDLNLPWPVEDRDMVMRVKWRRDPDGKITAAGTSVEGVIPPQNDRVRVTVASELWELQSADNGGVTVVMTAHIDPAGPLPSWLVNQMSVDAPFDALGNLKKMVAATGQ